MVLIYHLNESHNRFIKEISHSMSQRFGHWGCAVL